jgi:SAM-dependent methyltransferase
MITPHRAQAASLPVADAHPPALAWLATVLRCPHDGGPVSRHARGLVCATCASAYGEHDGIPHLLDEAALASSAKDQMALYDARFRQMGGAGQERLFASEFVYRTQLLARALALLGVGDIAEDDLWLYVGGGEGTQCMALSERGGRHVSFDVSLGQLKAGRWLLDHVAPAYFRRLRADRVAFVWGDGEQPLPFADGCAAAAYGIGVLNHLPPTRWTAHLSELARTVRDAGLVFQIVPNPDSAFFQRPSLRAQFARPDALQYWTQFITRAGVEEAFRQAGLRNVRTHALWPFDHDRFPGRWWRVDFAVSEVIRRVGARWTVHPGITAQRVALSGCDRGARWARRFTYEPPKHLLVAGTR